MLLDGAENWDWTDMEADFMTPKKKSASPKKVRLLLKSTINLTPSSGHRTNVNAPRLNHQ